MRICYFLICKTYFQRMQFFYNLTFLRRSSAVKNRAIELGRRYEIIIKLCGKTQLILAWADFGLIGKYATVTSMKFGIGNYFNVLRRKENRGIWYSL